MNWKLIFQLSIFGLVMAFATVFWVPSKTEPFFWLGIFILCAWLIAKNAPGKYFVHGFLVSLVNCVWVTGVHIAYYNTYISTHQDVAEMFAKFPLSNHPRLMMLITGPFVGIISGLVLGLFAFIASRLVKRPVTS